MVVVLPFAPYFALFLRPIFPWDCVLAPVESIEEFGSTAPAILLSLSCFYFSNLALKEFTWVAWLGLELDDSVFYKLGGATDVACLRSLLYAEGCYRAFSRAGASRVGAFNPPPMPLPPPILLPPPIPPPIALMPPMLWECYGFASLCSGLDSAGAPDCTFYIPVLIYYRFGFGA